MDSRCRLFCIIDVVVTVFYLTFFMMLGNVLIERKADYLFILASTVLAFISYIILLIQHKEYRIKKKNIPLFLVFSFIIFFMYWGYGLTVIHTQYGGIATTVVAILLVGWVLMMSVALMNIISFVEERLGQKNFLTLSSNIVFVTIFLVMVIGTVTATRIFHPGVISPDNMEIYKCALHLDLKENRSDIHSFAMILLIRFFTLISYDYYLITVSFAVTYSLVWAFMIKTLYNYGLPFTAGLIISILFVLLPTNIYLFAATWKDIPFCISMLLFTTMIIKMVFEKFNLSCVDIILLVIGMLGTALFRSNGQVVLIVCGVIFIIVGVRKKNIRVLISVCFSVALLILFKAPLFYVFDVDRGPEGFSSIPFIDAVWENIYVGNELSKETIDYLNEIMPIEDFKNNYVESNDNYYVFPNLFDDMELGKSIRAYLECFRRYPITTIKARLKRIFNLWSVFPNSRFSVTWNSISDISLYTKEYGYDWKYPDKYRTMREKIDASMTKNEDLYLLFIRGSFWFALSVLLCFYCIICEKKIMILIILPAIVNHLTLCVACCFQDYRYSWPMFVMGIPFVCVCFLNDQIYRNRLNGVCELR